MLLSNQWVRQEVKREIKKDLETNETHNISKPNGFVQKSSFKRLVYSDKGIK